MRRFTFVFLPLALVTLVAGCTTTPPTSYPSASPAVFIGPDTNAPRIENSDAAGVLSAPGSHSVTTPAPGVVTPAPAAPAPGIVVPNR